MTDEAARLACDAWDRAKFAIAVRGGPEAQRAVRALIVDGVVSPDRDSLRAGLTTRRD